MDLYSDIGTNLFNINNIDCEELVSMVLNQMDDELNIKIMDKEIEKGKINFPYNIEK